MQRSPELVLECKMVLAFYRYIKEVNKGGHLSYHSNSELGPICVVWVERWNCYNFIYSQDLTGKLVIPSLPCFSIWCFQHRVIGGAGFYTKLYSESGNSSDLRRLSLLSSSANRISCLLLMFLKVSDGWWTTLIGAGDSDLVPMDFVPTSSL